MKHRNETRDVSVIVPTYNGAVTIVACLRSIERALEGRSGEIIVVDSSTDDTAEVVAREFPGVRLIRSADRLTAGGARNRGLEEAAGRLIGFTDQDCEVPADWIDRLAALLEKEGAAGAGGSVGIANLGSASGNALYFLEFLNHFPGERPVQRDPLFLVGCNALYRRAALEQVRFPDQTLGEDVLFAQALYAEGHALVFDPSIEVAHHNRRGWKTFFCYNLKIGEAAASYHAALGLTWAKPFLRQPVLAFAAPGIVLPAIAIDLLRSRWRYFWRFLLLLPMCLLGNLTWAWGFRRQALVLPRERPAALSAHTASSVHAAHGTQAAASAVTRPMQVVRSDDARLAGRRAR
jgi:GT2 family glycosyltransferase